MFQLVPDLAKKDFVIDLPFSRVLLEDNADYPWIFLVPRKENTRNMLDLTMEERLQLMREIAYAESILNTLFHPDQLNTAAIGNKTPQLHVHIIARKSNDPAWPGTVWGKPKTPYTAKEKEEIIQKLVAAFTPFVK